MSHDPVAYTADASYLCPDCAEKRFGVCEEHKQVACCVTDSEGNQPGVIAPWNEEPSGATCDACGACYVSGEWLSYEDATDKTVTRWATCSACNAAHPYQVRSCDYRDARRSALRGKLSCDCCGRNSLHF